MPFPILHPASKNRLAIATSSILRFSIVMTFTVCARTYVIRADARHRACPKQATPACSSAKPRSRPSNYFSLSFQRMHGGTTSTAKLYSAVFRDKSLTNCRHRCYAPLIITVILESDLSVVINTLEHFLGLVTQGPTPNREELWPCLSV